MGRAMAFPRRTLIFSLLNLAAVFGNCNYSATAQVNADRSHRDPILISDVKEPGEMSVEPLPFTKFVPTAPEQMLTDAMKSTGDNNPAALLPALSQILAKYPDFSDGYVMRLGALCDGKDLVAIASDINNALIAAWAARTPAASLGCDTAV